MFSKSHQSSFRYVFLSIGQIGLAKALSIPLVLAISVVFARNLTPAQFGNYALAWTLATIGAAAASGGLSQLVTRETAKWSHSHAPHADIIQIVSASVRLAGVSILGMSALLTIIQILFFSDSSLSNATLFLIFIGSGAVSLGNLANAGLRGLERPAEGQFFTLVVSPACALVAFVALSAYRPPTTTTALLGMSIGYSLGALLSQLRLAKSLPRANSQKAAKIPLKKLVKQSASLTLISVLTILSLQLNVLLSGYALGPEGASHYFIADKIALIVGLPVGIIELVLAARVVRLYKAREIDQMRAYGRLGVITGLSLTLLFAIPPLLWGEEIIRLMYGEDYVASVILALPILLFAQVLRALVGPLSVFLLMTGHQRYCVFAHTLGVASLVLATPILGEEWGISGVAMGFLLSTTASLAVMSVGIWRGLGLRPIIF